MTKQEKIEEKSYEPQWLEAEIELACRKWEMAQIYGIDWEIDNAR